MKRLFAALDRAPLYWVAVGLGLLVFSLNRQLPPDTWSRPLTEQGRLDQAFVESLRSGELGYALMPEAPQTFGSHVLSQVLVAQLSRITGDAARAGLWLSLLGIVGVITGLYILAIRIYPLRGFAVATVLAAGALGTLHSAVAADPSSALGMALVVWGMAFFLTAVTERKPHDVFASGILFGLAGTLRFELSLIWVFLALYLILLALFHGRARKPEASAVSMALGGLFTVAIVLWPLVHRNIGLAGTPLLPGYDAELILGAPALAGEQMATPFAARFALGLRQLTIGEQGPGVFAGLLWPIGMALCLVLGRHQKIPFFWIPVLLGTLLGMTALSAVTGGESYLQTLEILSPLLFPFALLPLAFVVEQVLQQHRRSPAACRWIWTGVAAGFVLLIQLPNFFRSGSDVPESSVVEWVEDFSALPEALRNATLVSDQPGPLVSAGKWNVIGTRGQTDWTILTTATAHGGFQPEAFLSYLNTRGVTLLHLSDPEDPLVDRLKLSQGAPDFEAVSRIRPPHRLFSISWP